jgi:hypothetical protein
MLLHACVLDAWNAHNVLHQVSERLLGAVDEVFEADDVDGDLACDPPGVEVSPDTNFLLHVQVPAIGILLVSVFGDGQIV